MALPASGQITMAQVRTLLAASGQISLNDSIVRTLFNVASGEIELADGYGKASDFTLTISSNTKHLNVRTAAIAAGWNGTSKLTVEVQSGAWVYGSNDGGHGGSAGPAGMYIAGSFPGGLTIENSGKISGAGGGRSRTQSSPSAANGSAGIYIETNYSGGTLTIKNLSGAYIAGGGGRGVSGDWGSNGTGFFASGGGGAGNGNRYAYNSGSNIRVAEPTVATSLNSRPASVSGATTGEGGHAGMFFDDAKNGGTFHFGSNGGYQLPSAAHGTPSGSYVYGTANAFTNISPGGRNGAVGTAAVNHGTNSATHAGSGGGWGAAGGSGSISGNGKRVVAAAGSGGPAIQRNGKTVVYTNSGTVYGAT